MLARDQVGRQLLAEVDSLLLDAFKEIVRRLVLGADQLSPRESARTAVLFQQVSEVLADRYGTVGTTLTAALQEFSAIEAEIARQEIALRVGGLGNLSAQLQGLPAARVVSIADLFVEGTRLPDWWREQARKMAAATRRQVQLGLIQGETAGQIVKRIVPARGSVEPSVYRQARREADTIIRTATTAVSAETQLRTLAAMDPRITDRYEWVAIRDARTSLICIGLDGKQFRYDDPKAPRPPAHWNCRSTIRPVINRRQLKINDPKEPGPGGWKDYEAWLLSQSELVQRRVLGPGRWQLWRSGKISLQQLVNSDGRRLTLAQLRELSTGAAAPLVIVSDPAAAVATSDASMRRTVIDPVVEAVGLVHGVPERVAPVRAYYRSRKGAEGFYIGVTNEIGIRERRPVDVRRATFVHEFGHFLDAQAFGVPKRPAGPAPYSKPEYHRYMYPSARTTDSPAWQEWWAAVESSEHYKHWKAEADAGSAYAQDYMTLKPELFARAYERWVAERMPDTSDVGKALRARFPEQELAKWFWSREDFAKVRAAMTRLFREAGWLR